MARVLEGKGKSRKQNPNKEVRFDGDPLDVVVSTADAAKFLKVSDQTIRNMRRDGYIEPVSRGVWNLVKLIKARELQHKTIADDATKNSSANRATDARTREIELRIAKQEGKFVPIAEFNEWFETTVGEFVVSLTSLPKMISRDQAERARIVKICDHERSRLAASFRKRASALLKTG